MRTYGRKDSRWLAASVLALAAGIGILSWLRLANKAEPQHAPPLSLSDVEGQSVPIPSLPSLQMHLIPRTQPTPLSPVPNWKAMSGDDTTPLSNR